MKLSYRDKIILTVAVVILTLILGISFIIVPSIKNYNANKDVLAQKTAECEEIDAKIEGAKNIDSKIKEAYKNGVEKADFFFPEMDTYQVDQFLLPYCAKNHVEISSLSLSLPEAAAIDYYVYDIMKPDYPLLHSSDLNDELNYNGKSGEEGVSEEVAKVTVTLEGSAKSLEEIYTLIDELDALEKSVSIVSLEGNSGSEKDLDKVEFNLALDFYSVRTISEPDLD